MTIKQFTSYFIMNYECILTRDIDMGILVRPSVTLLYGVETVV